MKSGWFFKWVFALLEPRREPEQSSDASQRQKLIPPPKQFSAECTNHILEPCCYKYSTSLARSGVGNAGGGAAAPTTPGVPWKAPIPSEVPSTLCSCLHQTLLKVGPLREMKLDM